MINRTASLLFLVLIIVPQSSAKSQLAVFACRQIPATERTGVFRSRSGARAFLDATARVIATGKSAEGDRTHRCRTDWKLHVAAPGEDSFREFVVYSYTDPEFSQVFGGDSSIYFGGELLEWSADGTMLLAQIQISNYEDWYTRVPVVYRLNDRKWWATDLNKLYERQPRPNSKPCALATRILGFAPDNRVLVEAEPFEWADVKNCLPKTTWLLDFEAGRLDLRAGASGGQ